MSDHQTVGRLGQVCDRWIYSCCTCFGLDFAEQQESGFRYCYSVYQVEHSRNFLFEVGGEMDRVFNAMMERTRSRLDVPKLKTLFGLKHRPRQHRTSELSPQQAVAIETPRWDLTLFKVHFGKLSLKGYTKGERVLRFESIVHNTSALKCGRALERFPEIVTRLAGMTERFTSMLDCVDIGYLPDGILDELPNPSQIGATRVGGVDVNKPRIRRALGAVLALTVAPDGFTVADFTSKVHAMNGLTEKDYTIRQGAYDLRKLRGKRLIVKQGRSNRYRVPEEQARILAALTVLREQVIGPILAGVKSPREGRKPNTWTKIDADYQDLRIGMQTLFRDLGITTLAS